MTQVRASNPGRPVIFLSVLLAVGTLALSACAPSKSAGVDSVAPARSRVQDPRPGVSYTTPKGYHSDGYAAGQPAEPEPSVKSPQVSFLLDGPQQPAVRISLWKLSKDDPGQAQLAAMDVGEAVELIAKTASKDKPGTRVERTSWGAPDFPAAAISIVVPDSAGGPGVLNYNAFIGRGEQRWMVQAAVSDTPPGVSFASVALACEALARSVRPL